MVHQRLRHVDIQNRQDLEDALFIFDGIVGLLFCTRGRNRILAFILACLALQREGQQGFAAAGIGPGDDFALSLHGSGFGRLVPVHPARHGGGEQRVLRKADRLHLAVGRDEQLGPQDGQRAC